MNERADLVDKSVSNERANVDNPKDYREIDVTAQEKNERSHTVEKQLNVRRKKRFELLLSGTFH